MYHYHTVLPSAVQQQLEPVTNSCWKLGDCLKILNKIIILFLKPPLLKRPRSGCSKCRFSFLSKMNKQCPHWILFSQTSLGPMHEWKCVFKLLKICVNNFRKKWRQSGGAVTKTISEIVDLKLFKKCIIEE